MPGESIAERYPEAVGAVRAFFAQLYGNEIEESEADDEEAILLHVGPAKKVVAVEADFLAEYDPAEIREHLAAWNTAHLSRTLERGCRLKITSYGTEEVRD